MSNVDSVYSNQFAFVVLHDQPVDGKYWLTAIGRADSGGNIPADIHLSLVMDKPKAVYSTYRAFTVITESGKVYSWGQDNFGGKINNDVRDFLNHHDMQYICASSQAFCAYNDDGDLIAWGDKDHGGDVPSNILSEIADHDGVYSIVAANAAFCAITNTRKKAYAWGNKDNGGTISGNALDIASRGNIVLCRATNTSFSIISKNGDVACWGGISQAPSGLYQKNYLNEAVVQNIKSYMSSVVLKECDNRSLAIIKTITGEQISLLSNDGAFVFVSRDKGLNTKNITAWGNATFGGSLNGDVKQTLMASKIVQIISTNGAFGCLVDAGKSKGMVVVWGCNLSQGDAGSLPTDPSISTLFDNNVICLYSLKMLPPTVPAPVKHVDPAMAAVLEDGSYVLWGGRITGGAIHVN
ncbi:TPA: hypothetical protein PP061_003933 [Salmonella bongori]|nr:hypothetical protein [Salmonella bongori]